jgi:hypothetical protein
MKMKNGKVKPLTASLKFQQENSTLKPLKLGGTNLKIKATIISLVTIAVLLSMKR